MAEFTRRSVLSTALFAGSAASVLGDDAANHATSSNDRAFVIAAGLTEEEAECWTKLAEAAGAFLKLPELHPMDQHEVASAIHVVQNKLLSRPTYRKYLEEADATNNEDQ